MSAERVAAILSASPGHRDALAIAALAGPSGGWIGAGFVRNAVWDSLSGRVPEIASLNDIDVAHFDHSAGAPEDEAVEAVLRAARGLPWSVINQARMSPPGHRPYRGVADAIAHWPETATAVAVRLAAGRIEVLAPHGLADLFAFRLRPTPAHALDQAVVRKRLATKGWQARWPALRIEGTGSR